MADTAIEVDSREEDFLTIETAARELADSLKRLDEESARYSSAASRLDAAVGETTEVLAMVKAVGDQAAKALAVVASVGGPEILKQANATNLGVSSLTRKVESLTNRLRQVFILGAATVGLLIVLLIVALVR